MAERETCWTCCWPDRWWRTLRIRGKAGVARSGTGSARPAGPAAAGGTCGDRWRDDVDHRCPDGTRRTTKMSTSALVAFAGLADGWRRACSGGGDGDGDDDDGMDGGAGAGADADAGGADNAAAVGDDASQGVRSSVLAERHGPALAC